MTSFSICCGRPVLAYLQFGEARGKREDGKIMIQNIFVGVMCVIVAAVAVWGWWLENGPEKKDAEKQEQERMQRGQRLRKALRSHQ